MSARYKHLNLHPESVAYLDFLDQYNDKTLTDLNDIRRQRSKRCEYSTYTARNFDVTRKEIHVPSPDVQDGIPVFVYTPNAPVSGAIFLVYFHGGGSVLGDRMMVDTVCKILTEDAECIVLNVEYCLAPEHKMPAQMDDGLAVVRWLKKNKQTFGAPEHSKIGVGGDSAGGRISASIAHDEPVDFQILVYPNVSRSDVNASGSITKYKDGPILTDKRSNWFKELTVPEGQGADPRWAPSMRTSFAHLPPTLIIVAEHDRLYDSGTGYAETLRNAGVNVECSIYKGVIHGFFPYLRMYPELAGRAHVEVVDFIKRMK